ncbi:uncharacterized protein N7477_001099 [Penicillium maclennaniae]|uniref:uncharacterized protein n=1 Tax=Penicillium maclennaniae TaxID=1343394 RepID=UPI002541BB18|nr:uncharacterized protein N7477_001099 [Penicillium maclennaniae]KAJ5684754.1 hypothetical protein N7477_001099 [Penicillium maclennaniae]
MSPQPDSHSEESPHFSNTDSDGIPSDHPDAPLSNGPYHDDSLAVYEPRPIPDVYDDYETVRPRSKWAFFWLRNKGMFLVLMAQMFGASMNVMTKVLEMYSSMHPFQVLFARMSITAIASYLYMWYASVPSPLGTRPVLGLLITRAVSGFMGVYGLYYSVQYLPLSEATVITFLAPIITCYACSLLIPGETFSRRQQAAGIVSLIGVVLIARPFRNRKDDEGTDSYHHILATVVAFFGVLGAAGAYTSIRMIGRRAHPLVSVTYFSSVTTVISAVAMLAVPGVPFRFPGNPTEWILLTGLGVCGFLLQFLLTAGLSYVPPVDVGGKQGQGSRATSMVYTQVLFALFYDKVVWGGYDEFGSALILVCAIAVAVMQEGKSEKAEPGSEPEPETEPENNEEERYKDADEEA